MPFAPLRDPVVDPLPRPFRVATHLRPAPVHKTRPGGCAREGLAGAAVRPIADHVESVAPVRRGLVPARQEPPLEQARSPHLQPSANTSGAAEHATEGTGQSFHSTYHGHTHTRARLQTLDCCPATISRKRERSRRTICAGTCLARGHRCSNLLGSDTGDHGH